MNKLKLSVGVLAFVGLATLNFTQSESCFVSKALASGDAVSGSEHASVESIWESQWNSYNSGSDSSLSGNGSSSSGGEVINHGNKADKRCPIWEITIVTTEEGEETICKTNNGSYKCVDAPCPHGA